MEASSGGVCPSTSCWKEPFGLVSNKHCPLSNICVYDSIKGAITDDTENQEAAITRKWRMCLKSRMLTFRSVAVIAAFMQWQQHTSFVLAMIQLALHGNTINFAHTFRDALRDKQSSHFRGKT